MKIVIMGAGVIGVSSAYFLAKMGHKVTVIEKNPMPAMGCSGANGGQLSFSHIEPFSSKSSLNILLKALLKPNSFVKVEDKITKQNISLLFNLLRNCSDAKVKLICEKLFMLGQESKGALSYIINEEKINFEHCSKGILHFFRNTKLFEKAIRQAEFQIMMGDKIKFYDKNETVNLEPTLVKLHDQNILSGSIHHQNDSSGNAEIFTKELAKICQEKYGVSFCYNTKIRNILTNRKKITGINSFDMVHDADIYIYAMGSYGNNLLSGIGLDPKIIPVKGHSLSIPIESGFFAPKLSLTDPENKIVYSRLNKTFRAAGTMEITSNLFSDNKKLTSFLEAKIKDTFSDYGNINNYKSWTGLRPYRTRSIPMIGQVKKYQNLFINSGHGHLGWSFSCGSAKILSEMISARMNKNFSFLQEEVDSTFKYKPILK